MAPRRFFALAAIAAAMAVPTTAAAGPVQSRSAAVSDVLPSVKEKVVEEFPTAVFPAGEEDMCSPAEHSFYGPTSYCFAEFTTGDTWNMVEASVPAIPFPGTAVNIYGHTTWQRRWRRCRFRLRVPGKAKGHYRRLHIPGELFSNEDCGRGQPEQPLAETDGDLFEFEAWPRIRAHRPLPSVTRSFIYANAARGLARYRAAKSNGTYTFTNALGDSFRYTPYGRNEEPRVAADARIPLIRGGEAAKPGDLPSLVFIAYLIPNGKDEAIVCTGTVIAPRLVLTAAHCLQAPGVRVEVENFRVVTGEVDWKAADRTVVDVARTIPYPRYDSESGQGDAALLELATPTAAPPMPIAARRFWEEGTEAEIAGWGRVQVGRHDNHLLHRAGITILGSRLCREEGGSSGQVCAEDPPPQKATTCFGDSGGPLLAHRPGDGELVEVGVVHGGQNCNPRYAGTYTSTVPIFHWVRARIAEGHAPRSP